MYDLLLRNAHVIDPVNHFNAIADVAVEDEKIALVAPQIEGTSKQTIDCSGKILQPGIIDSHTHIRTLWGTPHGQRMLALAGVTTTLDMAGPLENILSTLDQTGAGLTIAVLESAAAPFSLSSQHPDAAERTAMIDRSLEQGALGIKLMGGHYPMDLDICSAFIEQATQRNAWVAWHVGNTEHGSNIEGLRDAVACAGSHFLHVAHVNSYCRGQISTPEQEALEAIELLRGAPQLFSESYVSPLNGTRLTIENDLPVSHVTRKALELLGFTANTQGVREALLAGAVGVVYDNGSTSELIYGERALRYWLDNKTVVSASFAVNPASSRMLLASARRSDGSFVVDAISTDGGVYPRNAILEKGLCLVKFGAMTLSEFALKTAVNPARALRLNNKGHLCVGADADITVYDLNSQKACTTVARGTVIMHEGKLRGRGSHIVCTERGEAALRRRGLRCTSVDLSRPMPTRFVP